MQPQRSAPAHRWVRPATRESIVVARKTKLSAKLATALSDQVAPDGYEGQDVVSRQASVPASRHSGAVGAGLVQYSIWWNVVRSREVTSLPKGQEPGVVPR